VHVLVLKNDLKSYYDYNNYQKYWALIGSLTIYRKLKPMYLENEKQIKSVPENHKKMLQTMGHYIRELRLAYGMTQTEFSTQQRIGKNSLQNAEYGRNITLLTLFKIIDELVSPNELFEDIK
jgi:DNA-binding transcriptional regulator YiaG